MEFRCNGKFRLVGTPRLECIDGRWNGKLPFCESTLSLHSITFIFKATLLNLVDISCLNPIQTGRGGGGFSNPPPAKS